MKFNINDHVSVKLTDYGREIIKKENKRLQGIAPALKIPSIKEDEDGWSKWQLWSLMEMFGQYIHMGTNIPFETTIEIHIEDNSHPHTKG